MEIKNLHDLSEYTRSTPRSEVEYTLLPDTIDNLCAYDLAGDWCWVGYYVASTPKGKVGYEQATACHGTVCLEYMSNDLRVHRRYIPNGYPMVLRRI